MGQSIINQNFLNDLTTYWYLLLCFFKHKCGFAIQIGIAYNCWTKNFCKVG